MFQKYYIETHFHNRLKTKENIFSESKAFIRFCSLIKKVASQTKTKLVVFEVVV